jgi:hypothetical protein
MSVVSQPQEMLRKFARTLLGRSQKTSLITRNRQLLRDADVILLSYPRSGNSWTRYLIADLVLQHHHFATATELPIDSVTVIPSIYTQDLETIWDERLNQLPYRIIKSHEHVDVGTRKIIYVFRQPADVLTSFYYFRLNHPDPKVVEKLANRDIDQFCQEEVNLWITHLDKALQRHDEDSQSICWICYEKLHQDPQTILNKVVTFLNLETASIDVPKAIENHAYANRVKVVKETANDKELTFNLRSGSVGTSRKALSPETQALIQEKTHKIYERAYALM